VYSLGCERDIWRFNALPLANALETVQNGQMDDEATFNPSVVFFGVGRKRVFGAMLRRACLFLGGIPIGKIISGLISAS
jgi:hypothetical protein